MQTHGNVNKKRKKKLQQPVFLQALTIKKHATGNINVQN